MISNHFQRIRLSRFVGMCTLFCVLSVFCLNVYTTNTNIYGQVFLYWMTFAVALLTIFLRKRIYVTDLYLIFYAIYIVLITYINQNLSILQFLITFGYMTWWIWIYIIFKFIWLSELSPNLLVIAISVFSVMTSIYLIVTYNKNYELQNWGYVNNSYYCLCVLPILWLNKSAKIRNIITFICILAIVLSFKRAGIVALSLILLFCVIYIIRETKLYRLRVFVLISTFIVLYVSYNVLINMFDIEIFRRFESLYETGGNGRLEIWRLTLENITSGKIRHLLFGVGYNGNIKYYGAPMSTHNDIFELLVDYGIVGLLMFLLIIFRLIKKCFINIKNHTEFAIPCIMTLCITFTLSLFSHLVIYPSYFIILLIFLIYIDSKTNTADLDCHSE